MRDLLIVALLLISFTIPSDTVCAETPDEFTARAGLIAPFLDEDVIAVGRIDLTRIDVAALVARLPDLTWLDRQSAADIGAAAGPWVEGFRKSGGTELFIIASLADIPEDPPFIVVPIHGQADERALTDLLTRITLRGNHPTFEVCERHGVVLLAASTAVLARIRKMEAAPRPTLAKAFAAAGNTAIQVLLVPSGDHRRVLREMLIRESNDTGLRLGAVLADGIHWSALGADFPPKLSLRGIVQSADAPAGKRLATEFAEMVEQFGSGSGAPENLPDIERLLKLLTPVPVGDRFVVEIKGDKAIGAFLAALSAPMLRIGQEIRHHESKNHLKSIGLAMHNYHAAFNSFPAQASYDAMNKPILSWRVHILPYLNQDALYREFHLEEPWDSPHNRKLIGRMPDVYRNGTLRIDLRGMTTYLAPVGEATVFNGRAGVAIRDILDGTVNTIMLIDACDDRAVTWTSPADWEFDPHEPAGGLFGDSRNGFSALFCDGAVQFVGASTPAKMLRGFFTRSGRDMGGF